MKLEGPEKYELACTETECTFRGTPLSTDAKSGRQKLYLFLSEASPVYVGITTQPIRARLRYGFKAKGEHGYHGYSIRNHLTSFTMLVWYHAESNDAAARADLEAVEAEVAFLIRLQDGQWPRFQTEIHFHQSEPRHQTAAKALVDYVVSAGWRPKGSFASKAMPIGRQTP